MAAARIKQNRFFVRVRVRVHVCACVCSLCYTVKNVRTPAIEVGGAEGGLRLLCPRAVAGVVRGQAVLVVAAAAVLGAWREQSQETR